MSLEKRRAHAAEIVAILKATYPDAHCALVYRSPLELLIATILSAQCTDERVNEVTPKLFAAYPDARALAAADAADIERIIRSTGFFRAKAKAISQTARLLVEKHGGKVPATMEELTALRGVGRKTANVVLGNAYGIDAGIVVDTHVGRLSRRLGLSRRNDPEKVERDLMAVIERADWTLISHLLIYHGRWRCMARRPDCGHCELAALCPSAGSAVAKAGGRTGSRARRKRV
jgi:endonuclease-3